MRYIPEFLIVTIIFLLMDIVVQRLNIIDKLFNHKLENRKNLKAIITVMTIVFILIIEFAISLSNQIFSGKNYVSLILRGIDIFIVKEFFVILFSTKIK